MMRALTLWQPWGTSLVKGSKDVENRPKPPPRALLAALEPIAIHAGLRYDPSPAAWAKLGWPRPGEPGFEPRAGWPYPKDVIVPARADCPLGAVIGVATMVGYLDTRERSGTRTLIGRDVVTATPDRALRERLERLDSERWWIGPVGILLVARRALPRPVPCSGALGYWTLPDDVEREVREQLRSAA